jgi:hypothetical protein
MQGVIRKPLLLLKKKHIFQKNDTPGDKIPPETKTYTQKDIISQKNGPPEARYHRRHPQTRAFIIKTGIREVIKTGVREVIKTGVREAIKT